MVYINVLVPTGSVTVDPTGYATWSINTATVHGLAVHVCEAGAGMVHSTPAELVARKIVLAGAAMVGGLWRVGCPRGKAPHDIGP
jgi:hypothetical protein